MFCLRCGAELPARATVCAVCGEAISDGAAPGTSGAWRHVGAIGSTLATSPSASGAFESPFESPVAVPMANAGRWAALWADGAGATPSRLDLALLGMLAVLALDLLLPVPWLDFGGVGFSARYLLGPLDALPLLLCALAATPLVYPHARSVLLLRLVPWALGTTLVGASLAIVLLLLRLSRSFAGVQMVQIPQSSSSGPLGSWVPLGQLGNTSSSVTVAAIMPSTGVVVALLCGLALIVLGYLYLRATPAVGSSTPPTASSFPTAPLDDGVGG